MKPLNTFTLKLKGKTSHKKSPTTPITNSKDRHITDFTSEQFLFKHCYHIILLTLFCMGTHPWSNTCHAGELLGRTTFDSNSDTSYPWMLNRGVNRSDASFNFTGNTYRAVINNHTDNPWDLQLSHENLRLTKGKTYTLKYKVRATEDASLYVSLRGMWFNNVTYWKGHRQQLIKDTPKEIEVSFTVTKDIEGEARIVFDLGGYHSNSTLPTYIFEYMSFDDPQFTPQPTLEIPIVRVNQVGYTVESNKFATIVHDATMPLQWLLKDASGYQVDSGSTSIFGEDGASGDHLHHADFSSFITPGKNYTLVVVHNGKEYPSHPFDIEDDIYKDLRYKALEYFYHNRSGIAITMPYAGRENLTRNSMHSTDLMPTWPNDPRQQDYTLDITGGWYDAGDTGKYAITAASSLWNMMNTYERGLHTTGTATAVYADGKMNIPENNNGIPDILDEARYEMNMFLNMQVPDSYAYAGMVHHKGHSYYGNHSLRYLAEPTTRATLSLAAAGAQMYRVWKNHDASYAQKCLDAAEKAWIAASNNPDKFITRGYYGGGGDYSSYGPSAESEFYWAACELYITTGKSIYQDHLLASKYFAYDFFAHKWSAYYGFFNPANRGNVSLAMIPNELSSVYIDEIKQAIIKWADVYLSVSDTGEGYKLSLSDSEANYPWGSNSVILTQSIAMALAYDFTEERKYFEGVLENMNYLMGRNALDQSYIAGYGERPVKQLFHYYWSGAGPTAPTGTISLGPNQGLQDQVMWNSFLPGTPAQRCFIDDDNSYSTNETLITVNSLLTWVSAFLSDELDGIPQPEGTIFKESQSKVCMEAENFSTLGSNDADGDTWQTITSGSDHIGNGYIQALSNNGSNARSWNDEGCELSFDIEFNNLGNYYVYIRYKADTYADDSYHYGLNGIVVKDAQGLGASSQWKWHKGSAKIAITSTGIQTFTIRKREDGLKIDRIVLSTSSQTPQGDGPPESQTISNSTNTPPVANAGPDQSVNQGIAVTLDGSASSDANGDSLTYAWTQTSGPEITSLSDSNSISPSFTASVAGVYEFTLTVSDGSSSHSDDVTITVQTSQINNLLNNGDFSNGLTNWTARAYSPAIVNFDTSGGDAKVEIVNEGTQAWHIQLFQNIDLKQGHTYTLSFDVKGYANSQSMNVLAQEVGNDWTVFKGSLITINNTGIYTRKTMTWTQSEDSPGAKIVFVMGNQGNQTWSIDNVVLTDPLASAAETKTLTIGSNQSGGVTTSNGLDDRGSLTASWDTGDYLYWNTPVDFASSGYKEARIKVSWKDSSGLAPTFTLRSDSETGPVISTLEFTQKGWSPAFPIESSFKGKHTLYLVCENKPKYNWFAISDFELINN